MTMGDQVTVTMTGGGPYGFRLFGGDNIPLSVAKIRRRSKSADAGLLEGDILLGINGYSCRGVAHATAMALAEGSGDMLVFQCLRGANDQQSVDAAYGALGSQLTPMAGSAGAMAPSAAPPGGRPMINSHVTPASQYSRQERTFHEGDTTTRMTSETRTDQMGDMMYRQTHTERLTTTSNAPHMLRTASPSQQQPPRRSASPLAPVSRFQVSNFAPPPAQSNQWRPPSSSQGMVVSAPSGVAVQQNPDRSVTMTIGLGGDEAKENVSPYGGGSSNMSKPLGPPMFKVTKVTTTQPKGLWTPAGGMAPKPAPMQQRTPSPRMDTQRKWQPRQPAPVAFKLAPTPHHRPEPEPADLDQDVAITPADFRGADEAPIPIDIQKLMFGGSDSGTSTPDSPATIARKKKIYADSSFYDDPEHKYPTIEEQIKMARKVAMSLMAPQNKRARGHTMFMKRRQGSSRWVAGEHPEPYDAVDLTAPAPEQGEKYYRPDPWKAPHTWQAPSQQYQQQQQFQPYQPPPQHAPPQQPAPEPYERGWGQPEISAKTWGRTEPVWGTGPPSQPQQQQQYQPQPAAPPAQQPAAAPPPSHTWQPFGQSAAPAQPKAPAPSWAPQRAPAAQPQPTWEAPKAMWEPSKPSWEPQGAPAPPPAAPAPPPPPPPPPAPPLPDPANKTMWRAPQLPAENDEERMKALSYDEFEKVRLLSQKTLHNQVSPQVCFSLASDLRAMKGKGGKLFAKRRAKAEQWVVDENPQPSGPNKDVMEKIVGRVAMEQSRQMGNLKTGPIVNGNNGPSGGSSGGPHKPRLQEMIAKPAMTPWEAASSGNLDAAFSHLNKRSTIHGDNLVSSGWTPSPMKPSTGSSVASSLTLAAPSTSVMPSQQKTNYNRQIKGWGSVSGPAPSMSGVSKVAPPMSSGQFKPQQQGWGGGSDASGASSDSLRAPAQAPAPNYGGAAAPPPENHLRPMGAASPYHTPPQRLSPQPQHHQQQQPQQAAATNGEVFYDAPELPEGGEGYCDL